MKPFVGLPTTYASGQCAYAADLDSSACEFPGTVHLIGRSSGWGLVALTSCEYHKSIARASLTEVLDAHPAEGCDGGHSA